MIRNLAKRSSEYQSETFMSTKKPDVRLTQLAKIRVMLNKFLSTQSTLNQTNKLRQYCEGKQC